MASKKVVKLILQDLLDPGDDGHKSLKLTETKILNIFGWQKMFLGSDYLIQLRLQKYCDDEHAFSSELFVLLLHHDSCDGDDDDSNDKYDDGVDHQTMVLLTLGDDDDKMYDGVAYLGEAAGPFQPSLVSPTSCLSRAGQHLMMMVRMMRRMMIMILLKINIMCSPSC